MLTPWSYHTWCMANDYWDDYDKRPARVCPPAMHDRAVSPVYTLRLVLSRLGFSALDSFRLSWGY